jgi:hypothetical protein
VKAPLRAALLLSALWLAPRDAAAAGAMDVAAQEAVQALGLAPTSSVVVAAPLTSDQPAPQGDDLVLRMAALVAGRIGASARAHPQTAALGPARAIAGRASALVYVQTAVSKGDLRTTVDVYPSMGNAWDRIRNPLPSPIGHAFSSVKIDAEVRSFLTPLLLEQASVHRIKHDEPDVIAAACGDVDGDGGDELVLVSRERVSMGRIRGDKFVVERTAAWSELATRAPVPMREPLAGAVALEGAVAVGSTDRGSVSLTADFAGHAPLPGVPALGLDGIVCLMPEPSAGAFDGAPFDCTVARDVKPKMAVPSPRFDAFAAGTIADSQGNSRAVVAVREPSGKLRLRVGDAQAFVAEGTVGAALAVCDLDQDGVPEIAAGADGPDDALDIWTLAPDGTALKPRVHLAAPAGVRALAVCPPEDHGQPTLVAVVGNEVWLVRASPQGAPP